MVQTPPKTHRDAPTSSESMAAEAVEAGQEKEAVEAGQEKLNIRPGPGVTVSALHATHAMLSVHRPVASIALAGFQFTPDNNEHHCAGVLYSRSSSL